MARSGEPFFTLKNIKKPNVCLVNPQRLFIGLEKNDKKQNQYEVVDT